MARQAEQLAQLAHLPHRGWHTLRRAWATARKHLPLADAMAAGGWSDPTSLQTAYQQPDVDTLQKVVDQEADVRALPA